MLLYQLCKNWYVPRRYHLSFYSVLQWHEFQRDGSVPADLYV